MSDKAATRAAVKMLAAVAEAIRDLGEVPSGHLYARLQDFMTLQQYQQVIDALKRANVVSEAPNHLLTWIGGKP